MSKHGLVILMVASILPCSSWAKKGGERLRQVVEYSIPVAHPGLEPYATHRFSIKWDSTVPGQRSFEYDIPVELDGVGQEIHLTEVAPNQFEGPKATAICQETEPVACRMTYKNLASNASVAEAVLAERYTDPTVFAGRSQVSLAFRLDPEPGGIMIMSSSPVPGRDGVVGLPETHSF